MSFLFVPVPLLDKLESTDCTSEASASAVADGLSERFPKLPYKEEKSKALKQDTFKGQPHSEKKELSHHPLKDHSIRQERQRSLKAAELQYDTRSSAFLTYLLPIQVKNHKDIHFTFSRYLSILHQNTAAFPNSQGI